MSEFPLSLTATEIDAALGKAHAPDTTLTGTIGSDPSLVTAGAVKTALDNLPILTTDTVATGITDSESHGPSSAGLLDHLLNVLPNQMLKTTSISTTFAGRNTNRHSGSLYIGAVTGDSDPLVGEIASNSSNSNDVFSVTLKKGGVYSFSILCNAYGYNYFQLRKGTKVLGNNSGYGTNTTTIYTVSIYSDKFFSASDQTVTFNLKQNYASNAQIRSNSGTRLFTVNRHGVGNFENL